MNRKRQIWSTGREHLKVFQNHFNLSSGLFLTQQRQWIIYQIIYILTGNNYVLQHFLGLKVLQQLSHQRKWLTQEEHPGFCSQCPTSVEHMWARKKGKSFWHCSTQLALSVKPHQAPQVASRRRHRATARICSGAETGPIRKVSLFGRHLTFAARRMCGSLQQTSSRERRLVYRWQRSGKKVKKKDIISPLMHSGIIREFSAYG